MNQHNWPDVVIALIPALILAFQYVQSMQSKRIEEKVEHVDSKTSTIEKKVDENTVVTNETRVSVNSVSKQQLEYRIVDLKELLVEKPGNISVIARLEAVQKELTDHIANEAVLKDRTKTAVITGPIEVEKINQPVEIKTKS